ncbi:uncharacterized protein LOC123721595 [Papilio machaon]|uniref:uncharacterized protein LOC123721595 n=1 Tax=Papilio machaon TaxID=76193 RepID=UPI001E665EB4|nr:uncharacterized protein LOC123721595 [Papilio machaon]
MTTVQHLVKVVHVEVLVPRRRPLRALIARSLSRSAASFLTITASQKEATALQAEVPLSIADTTAGKDRSDPICWTRRGRLTLGDEERSGRPLTAVTEGDVLALKNLVQDNRRITYQEIQHKLQIGSGSLKEFLHVHLRVQSIVSRRVPHNLTDVQKQARVDWCHDMIDKFEAEVFSAVSNKQPNTGLPKVSSRKRAGLPWWTEELSRLKTEVLRKKRRISSAAPVRREWVVKQYIDAKENYKREVKNAQTQSWKRFCGRQDRESMWDGIYRVIRRTAVRKEEAPLVKDGKVLEGAESARCLAEAFFPEDKPEGDDADHKETRIVADRVNEESHDSSCDPPFTRAELEWSASSFNPKKAPGPDGLTADICLAAITLDPDLFLAIANKCLSLSIFPRRWKEAAVVALPKPGRDDLTQPKSYRPIGLLPIFGKILEKMAVRRVRWYTAPSISGRQYGFMPQRSTEDSLYEMVQHIRSQLLEKKIVVLVSLDIEGAFDNAWWPAIRCRLAETRCPVNLRRMIDSYFSDRSVRVRFAGAEYAKCTTKGCVQGSIGGPTFWNLLLNPLLVELDSAGTHCQAFADDVVLMFSGESSSEIQTRANAALALVQKWGVRNKLKFAPTKTKAMVLTRRIKYDSPRLNMGGKPIELVKEVKVLGLTVDDRLTFKTHVANVCIKAQGIYRQLSRAARVSWGLNPEVIRAIYVAVVEPTILYAASAWAQAAKRKGTLTLLNRVQRGFALKIVRAYRTASLNSVLALAGLLPLDLRVQEAALLYEVKKGHSQQVLGDLDLELPVPYAQTQHPVHLEGLQFDCMADGDEVAQRAAVDVNIYTDGSKIEGKVGAALSIWDGAAETLCRKLKLGNFCTVYQAELLALHEATLFVMKSNRRSFGLHSDSRSALETVAKGDSLHPLAVKARENVRKSREQGKDVRLYWVKAHAGVEGNERADVLAKQAAVGMKTKPNYDKCPVSYVKWQLRLESLEVWNGRYRDGETASTTKVFFPDVVRAFPVLRKIDPDQVLTQVFTGHGGFSSYLCRFRCKESPSCICDPGTEESVLHLLTECPVSGAMRAGAEIEMDRIQFSSPDDALSALEQAVNEVSAADWKKCFENWFRRMKLCIEASEESFEKM